MVLAQEDLKTDLIDDMSAKCQVMNSNIENLESYINDQIAKADRTIERVKFEMTELLDTRHEQMLSKFKSELNHIQIEYEKALKLVSHMGNNLKDLFKEKTLKIKETCSTFFSKIDTNVS